MRPKRRAGRTDNRSQRRKRKAENEEQGTNDRRRLRPLLVEPDTRKKEILARMICVSVKESREDSLPCLMKKETEDASVDEEEERNKPS